MVNLYIPLKCHSGRVFEKSWQHKHLGDWTNHWGAPLESCICRVFCTCYDTWWCLWEGIVACHCVSWHGHCGKIRLCRDRIILLPLSRLHILGSLVQIYCGKLIHHYEQMKMKTAPRYLVAHQSGYGEFHTIQQWLRGKHNAEDTWGVHKKAAIAILILQHVQSCNTH